MLDKGTKKVDIARALGIHNATIYREIDRGSINGIYDPGHAEEQYRGHLSEKGRPAICSISPELAQHIAMLILEEKLSPANIIDRLQEEKWSTAPKARATIYSAIDGGLIPGVKAKLFCPEIAGLFCRIAGLFCHDSRANLSLKPVCFGIAIS